MKRIVMLFIVGLYAGFASSAGAHVVEPIIGGGQDYSIVLLSDGTVWTWGDNASGQLGLNAVDSSNRPVQVPKITDIVTIAGGYRHCLAVDRKGVVWGWGLNTSRQIGDGTNLARCAPTMIFPGTHDIVAVAAGIHHSIALGANNRIWAWGANAYGQLGLPLTVIQRGTPIRASELNAVYNSGEIRSIVCGGEHTLALASAPWSWGRNDSGQLGNSAMEPFDNRAGQVSGLHDFVMIAAGSKHTVALQSNGAVWAWGNNAQGQLGVDGTADQRVPVLVAGIENAVAVAAGESFSMALRMDGTVWSWGRNHFGQLGDGSTDDRFSPRQVEGIDDVSAIAGGGRHALAMQQDGSVWAWGNNEFGQLGDGTTLNRYVPVQVLGVRGETNLNMVVEVEPEPVEPEPVEPEQVEPEQVEPEQVEPEQVEPEQVEPEQVEPEQVEPVDGDDDDTIPAGDRGPRKEYQPGCFVGALFDRR